MKNGASHVQHNRCSFFYMLLAQAHQTQVSVHVRGSS
uniref:Uncharacterized protein n=1 Tax=Arundo donax TaxID=35708 RepID=A0A0A9BJA1_ARUDO